MNPFFYCDVCGHTFTHAKVIHNHADDERCPRCNNPDFELIGEKGVEVTSIIPDSTPAEGKSPRQRERLISQLCLLYLVF